MTTPDAQDPRLLSEEDIGAIRDLSDIVNTLERARLWARYAPQLLAHIAAQAEWNSLRAQDIVTLGLQLSAARAKGRAAAFEEAAKIADEAAQKNKAEAVRCYRQSSHLIKVGFDGDRAEQKHISAQAFDCIADEATYLAAAIRALAEQEKL